MYDIKMVDKNEEVVMVDSFWTFPGLVTPDRQPAVTNITFNFYPLYLPFIDSLRDLDGVSGAIAEPVLWDIWNELGTERVDPVWSPVAGNAGADAKELWFWCMQYPEGIFKVCA